MIVEKASRDSFFAGVVRTCRQIVLPDFKLRHRRKIPHFDCHARGLVHHAEGPGDKGDHHKEWDWQKMSIGNKNLQGQPVNCGAT